MSTYGELPVERPVIPEYVFKRMEPYLGNSDLSITEQIKKKRKPVIHLNEAGNIVVSYYSHETYNNDGIFKHKISTSPIIIDSTQPRHKYFKVDAIGNRFYRIADLIETLYYRESYPYSVGGLSRMQYIPNNGNNSSNNENEEDPTNGGGYRRHTHGKKHKRNVRRRRTVRRHK